MTLTVLAILFILFFGIGLGLSMDDVGLGIAISGFMFGLWFIAKLVFSIII